MYFVNVLIFVAVSYLPKVLLRMLKIFCKILLVADMKRSILSECQRLRRKG